MPRTAEAQRLMSSKRRLLSSVKLRSFFSKPFLQALRTAFIRSASKRSVQDFGIVSRP